MTDEQKEYFILKTLDKMASGKENLPDNPQVRMMVKHWKGMNDWQKKQLVKQILPQMSETIEKGEFDKMMGGMG